MNIQQAKYHLKRIQTIIDLHEGDLTSLDRDIVLDDIRKLYELILYSENKTVKDRLPSSRKPDPETNDIPESTETKGVPAAARTSSSQTIYTPPSSGNETPEEPKIFVPETRPQPDIRPSRDLPEGNHRPTETMTEEKQDPEPVSVIEPKSPPSAPEEKTESPFEEISASAAEYPPNTFPELFDVKTTGDLSERLGNSKIENLNQILAINDKILYINRLYNGEAIPFQDSLKKFESFYTFEEAKSYATEELVEQYQWTDKENADIARQFIKQVKRLYD